MISFILFAIYTSDIIDFTLHYFSFQIFYLMILSTNYSRIKSSKELTEYRDAVDLETRDYEMSVISNKKALDSET